MAAADFDKIIREGRERKANEKLASQIFSKNRRQSAPSTLRSPAPGPSLASRITKKGQRPAPTPIAAPAARPRGNINAEWTHDLHRSVSSTSLRHPNTSLGSRITHPNAPSVKKLAAKRKSRLANALDLMETDPEVAQQVNVKPAAAAARTTSFAIRGLAGPYCVMAQNFARGTTAADVESAFTPIGGPMESCRLIKEEPFILIEMMFSSREGGDRVIETFNNKQADGKILKVWASLDGPARKASSKPPVNAPSGPRASRQPRGNNHEQVVDGTMGFDEPMQVEPQQQQHDEPSRGGLYSDDIVNGRRGGGRGRGGRGGRGHRGR